VVAGFSAVVERALDGVDVRLASPVVGITLVEEGAALILANGESFGCERVVVTLPLGVLKSDAVVFDPPLPPHYRTAIDALGVGLRETVLLRFEERFWETDAVELGFVGTEAPVIRWVNLEPVTGEALLVGSIGPSEAARLAELSDDEVRDEVLVGLVPLLLSGSAD